MSLALLNAEEDRVLSLLARLAEAKRRLLGLPTPAPPRHTKSTAVLAWLRQHPGDHSAGAIGAAVGIRDVSCVRSILSFLRIRGVVARPARGRFRGVGAAC